MEIVNCFEIIIIDHLMQQNRFHFHRMSVVIRLYFIHIGLFFSHCFDGFNYIFLALDVSPHYCLDYGSYTLEVISTA